MKTICFLVLSIVGFPAACLPGESNVTTSSDAAPPIVFGAKVIKAALGHSSVHLHLILGQTGDQILKGITIKRMAVPAAAESYGITTRGDLVVIEGRDAAGAMYGALAAAEQLNQSGRIEPNSKSPFLAVRGINMFLTSQGFDEPNSWFWSDDFWNSFLDMMARDRYNFLDLHGPFDLTVDFPNGLPYLVYLPEYAEVGVGRERAARNLAQFRKVIRMATDRAIKVGYMNYTAAATIGPWKTGRFGIDERYVPRPEQYLPASRLVEYTRKAAATLLQQLPELWMFGFRIGESGQPEDFYKQTYVEAVKNSNPALKVYARTWIADPKRVREIADLTEHEFYIEPKYNGEQLGLPYQAVTGGRYYPPSGSWEDYSNYPRNYKIIWQIRANGTHRIFHWGWPEFARRTMRSCKFAGGIGFSMEPMNAYYPQTDYLHNNPDTKHDFYRWMFEQQWFWYMVWGRTAYDPDVPDRIWRDEFNRRFGNIAGPHVFNAVVESSKIVPFVYSYHNQGLDHQHMAPEYETGDHSLFARSTIWQGSRLVPYGGSYDDFLNIGTLDRTAMTSPVRYVDEKLNAKADGGMGPFAAAAYLENVSGASQREISQAAASHPESPKEFACMQMDVNAVAALGRYYADRIVSATHLQFYKRTFHHPELTLAWEYMQKAVQDWDELSDVTDRHFGYVPELIRMRTYKFRWRNEGRSLGLDLEDLNRLEGEFQQMPNRRATVIGHVPPYKANPGEPLTIVATQASGPVDARMHLLYRTSPDTPYTEIAMHPLNEFERTWTTEIPAREMHTGQLQYYFESYEGISGSYGSTLKDGHPYLVRINQNDSAPVISHIPPKAVHDTRVKLTVRVQGKATLESVQIYYKRMPAYYDWLSIEMKPEQDGLYLAEVPLTSEGILYYFTAADRDGNAVNFPDFLVRTPYFIVDAWDPKRP